MSEGLGAHPGWVGHGGEFMFRHPGCWGSDLGQGSWEDWTLMLWRLRGDFRLRRGKWAALHSGQSPCSNLLFFFLGARTTLSLNTAGTVVHPWVGENTQILGACSVGSLTAQERKEPEESWLLGRSQGVVGECPCLDSWGHMFLRPRIQESLVPVVQILRFSHLPLSVSPHR